MSTMYDVSVSDYGEFDRATALRRCLARGGVDRFMRARLARFDEWIELRFAVSPCHPDSRCGTSEELFLRLLADANMQAGATYEHTPVDDYYKGKLFKMDFKIEEHECPLAILELDYTPGAPRDRYSGGEEDAVEALVLVPKQLAPNIAGVGAFDSAAWGGARRLDDVARGARWARKRAEIRLVSASRQLIAGRKPEAYVDRAWARCGKVVAGGVSALHRHASSLYAVAHPSKTKVKGPWRLDADWNQSVVEIAPRGASFFCLQSDGDSLWVGGAGLYELRDDVLANTLDKKTGFLAKQVTALTLASDGALVVGTTGGFWLIRDGEIVESVDKGLGAKSIRTVAAAPNGDLWFGGYDGATRRNPDGSLDTFKTRQHVTSVHGLVCLADGSALIGMESPLQTTLHVAPGSQRTKPFEPVCDLGCVVDGFEHAGAQWLVTSSGMIAKVVDGQPVRAFVFDNIENPECTNGLFADGVVHLYGHATLYAIEMSTLEAALKRPADNVAIHGKRGLVSVKLGGGDAANSTAAASIDVAGKKVCITGTFSRLDRADVSVKLGALGASVVSGVTKATQILFAGDKAGSKLAKAKDLGIAIFGEDELLALVSAPAAAAVEAVKVEKPAPKADAAPNPFNGKKVVVTGTMQTMTRADISAKLAELGASVPGSISAKTDFLIAGSDAGSKLAKAKSLGVTVYSEDQFIAMIEGGGASKVAAAATGKPASKAAAATKPASKPAAAKPASKAAASKSAAGKGASKAAVAKPAASKPAAKQTKSKPATKKVAASFAGKTVVVTGTMQTMTRAAITARLEALGAKVGGSVSAKTDLLVVGLKAGSKLAKAKSLGVQVMTEDTFIELVGE